MYKNKFNNIDLSKYSFLVTGGAGFIGSNIVEYLLIHGARLVRVLDNLSNGSLNNLKEFKKYKNLEFVHGDICDYSQCLECLNEIDFVSHQAALGSVPRSIKDPINSNKSNVTGFLNMLEASRVSNVKKFIYAASSSTYGDSKFLPKVEETIGNPLSPYAVTKKVNEIYAEVYSNVYNFHSTGLRYFNVFGPKQGFNNPYAAVIPIFCENILKDNPVYINGDGHTSRDFTFVSNAVKANILALFHENNNHVVYNVACGDKTSLNELVEKLSKISNKKIEKIYRDFRKGDVLHSLASIEKAKREIGYYPYVSIDEGLEITYQYYNSIIK